MEEKPLFTIPELISVDDIQAFSQENFELVVAELTRAYQVRAVGIAKTMNKARQDRLRGTMAGVQARITDLYIIN